MIPWEVTLIPGFVLMRQLGWIDTHLALIVPGINNVFDSTNKLPLPVGSQLLNSQHGTDWTVLMAGDVISLIPVVAIGLGIASSPKGRS